MHEMGIACSVLDAVRTEADRHRGARVTTVALRIGEWAGVDPEALRFCFEAMAPSTALIIETVARQNRCPACERTFRVEAYETACPQCGGRSTRAVAGDELEIAYLEIEEP